MFVSVRIQGEKRAQFRGPAHTMEMRQQIEDVHNRYTKIVKNMTEDEVAKLRGKY